MAWLFWTCGRMMRRISCDDSCVTQDSTAKPSEWVPQRQSDWFALIDINQPHFRWQCGAAKAPLCPAMCRARFLLVTWDENSQAVFRPICGTAKSHVRTAMPRVCESRCQVSLSFSVCCEVHCLRLIHGIHDAKGVRFDCVQRSQSCSDLCWHEGKMCRRSEP